jgi:sugar/nucleoside kinase (ribokinase family)
MLEPASEKSPMRRDDKSDFRSRLTREPRRYDVAAFGENSVDLIARLPQWPAPDVKLALESIDVRPGGQVATAAIAAARLGARVRYVGVVGNDAWADVVRAALQQNGVDGELIVRAGVGTRTAVVLVDREGRRTVLGCRDRRLDLNPDELDADWVSTARVLMLDASDASTAVTLAGRAKTAGVAVMADIDQAGEAAASLLSVADVAITSAEFPAAQTGCASLGAALDELERRHRPSVLITTLGAHGAIARADGQEVIIRPPAVEVVDTTGAGDAFRGAFAASWIALGEHADLAEVVRRAVTAAALSCRGVGAQAALPSADELQKWL